jgi:hypothetical protein
MVLVAPERKSKNSVQPIHKQFLLSALVYSVGRIFEPEIFNIGE